MLGKNQVRHDPAVNYLLLKRILSGLDVASLYHTGSIVRIQSRARQCTSAVCLSRISETSTTVYSGRGADIVIHL